MSKGSRPRPFSDFGIKGKGMFGNYRSTGWLKDEYGLEGLRKQGMTAMSESNPKWHQFFKRPTKTYYFGQQGQQPMGFSPGQVDAQGMPTYNTGQNTNAPGMGNSAAGSDPGKGMGFLARQFYKKGNVYGTDANIDKNCVIRPNPGAISNIFLESKLAKHIRKYYNKDPEIFAQYATVQRTFMRYGYIAFKREEDFAFFALRWA